MRLRIENATIVDGTGAPGYRGAITIEDEHLAEVGEASLAPDEVLDARGQVVAPGFIDVHSHSDFTLPGQPEAEAKIAQGVTTEVVCNCGLGLLPANARVEKFYELIQPIVFGEPGGGCYADLNTYRAALEGRGVSVNVACLVPHGNVRAAVMGMEERDATDAEIGDMQELVSEVMSQGAFGLSTGLVYPPGAFATQEEVTRVVRAVKPFGGFYATHMRDEGTRVVQSIEEAIGIGRAAGVGVQISHHKAAGRLNWGKTKRTLAILDEARAEGIDVHSDVYPYTAGSTVLSAMVVPLWAFEGSQAQLMERLQDPATRVRIIRESKERLLQLVPLPGLLQRIIPKRVFLPIVLRAMSKLVVISSTRRQHHYEGKTLHEMARMRGQDLFEAILDLLVEEETAVAAIAHVMGEEDVQRVMRHPQTMIGTDGFPQREGKPHPRTYGTYPRVLERYVRELGVLTLEQAVHKSTGMVAAKLGLSDRGVLRKGARADLVLFEPGEVHDRATFEDPRNAPEGVSHVFVNGAWTLKDGAHTGARAGRVLEQAGGRVMTRVLLAKDVDRDAIDAAARAHGWPLLNVFRRTEARPRQIVFGSAEWILTFIEDHRIDARYAVIEGHDEDTLAEAIRASLTTLDLDDVLAMLATERVRALCWLGVIGPATPTEPVASLLAAAAASEDRAERDAASFAYQALGWPT